METESAQQHKTPSQRESVVSTPTTPEAPFEDAAPVAAESDGVATLEAKSTLSSELASNPQLGLSICPQCGQRSLFWNRRDYIYRCVNPECRRSYTLEEYRNRQTEMLPDELQMEQGPADMPTTEVIDKHEPPVAEETPFSESATAVMGEASPAVAERIPSNESMTTEPGVVEQVPYNEPITAAKDEIESGVVEQVPYNEPITAAKDEIESGAVEQILENISAAAVKDELERVKIDETPSNVPKTGVGVEVEAGANARKRMNRRLAFLIIGVLGIGIIMAGIFLWQKSGELNELSSQLTESKEALTASQAQLAMAQQDISGLSLQLTQARQEIEALQAQIIELRPLTPSEPFVYSGELSGGETISIPMELKQFERVEGSIGGGLGGLIVYIEDPEGGIADDLGRVFRSNFIFTASTSGTYTMIIAGSTGLTSSYTVNFTIYSLQ